MPDLAMVGFLTFRISSYRFCIRQSGDASKVKSYLPKEKQYLVTRNGRFNVYIYIYLLNVVPCRCRVASLEENYEKEQEDDEGWMSTHSNVVEEVDEMGDIEQVVPSVKSVMAIRDEHFGQDETGYANMDEFEEENISSVDESTYMVREEPEDGIVHTRTYDVSISYDKYYQTPRVWLFGYDEQNAPLASEDIMMDIMMDYANKTVTIEPHPHLHDVQHASIHPCQHAKVMKRIIDNIDAEDTRNDQYLFIFLKFIQSVIPTIDYDHTMQIRGK